MNREPLKLGITGSIGMGKTTIVREIHKFGFPIWEADTVVHNLYKRGKKGYEIIKDLVPEAVLDTSVNRQALANAILQHPTVLTKINNLLHPLINSDRLQFIQKKKNSKMLVFDIPLLFENACEQWLDKIIVATAPFIIQKNRVLTREAMTEDKFYFILSQQMSNEEKIKKADFIIDTNIEISLLSRNIKNIVDEILRHHD